MDLLTRLGRALKRLLGGQPVRLQSTSADQCFLLSDSSDTEAGRQVRHSSQLQLVGGESAPLVIDIDTLSADGSNLPAADAAFATVRLECATQLLHAMLFSHYGIRMHFFSSGNNGVHGFAFGTSLGKAMRSAVAKLLPGDASVFAHEAWHSDAVKHAVDAALRHLCALDVSTCADSEWVARLLAARAPNADLLTKLWAVTAVFDLSPTKSGQLRVPFAYNAKGDGFAGFALPLESPWPGATTIRRKASDALVPKELELLEAIGLPTPQECADILRRLRADCETTRKRALTDVEERRLRRWVPRLGTRIVSLPTVAQVRANLVPSRIRALLTPATVEWLEEGMKRGGKPPCTWHPEPDDDRRGAVSFRGGGTGRRDMCLALEALAGLNLTPDGRGDVARALLISAYPVDCFAYALKASPRVRRDVLQHWGSWFATFAKGDAKIGATAWRYDGGFLDRVSVQCPDVLNHCALAAEILTGRAVGVASSKKATCHAKELTFTGRKVVVVLAQSADEQVASVMPAIQERAARETDNDTAAAQRIAELRARAECDIQKLHRLAVGSTLTFDEYIDSGGRFGYSCGAFCGIKSILKELRPIVFQGMWRVDLKRCHTSMLIGAHGRAVDIGAAPDDPSNKLLYRMRTEMESVEADLRASQSEQLDDANARLRKAGGTDDEEHASKYIEYLQMEPKTLLSVMLNHSNQSPMFRSWPLAAKCCCAMGAATAVARTHPLVVADPHRPETSGITRGSPAERQRIAVILERRAVSSMVDLLAARGMSPSITVNDEVLFAPSGDFNAVNADALETELHDAVSSTLGFGVGLSMSAL